MSPDVECTRILLVEDDEDTAELLAESLEERGYVVWIANDGQSALALAVSTHPDLAILDLGLPDMDGVELARRLRAYADLAEMRLIAVTGYSRDEDMRRVREAGFDAHLIKPVLPHTLAKVIERWRPSRSNVDDATEPAGGSSRARSGHDLA